MSTNGQVTEQTFALAVEESSGGMGDDYNLKIRCNHTIFHVTIAQDIPPTTTTAGALLRKFDAACKAYGYDELEDLSEEIADLVCEAGWVLFRRLSGPPKPLTQMDLHTFLHPGKIWLRLVTTDGNIEFVEYQPRQPDPSCLQPMTAIPATVPRIPADKIRVSKSILGDVIIRVLVDGELRLCKISNMRFNKGVQRELHCLHSIGSSELATSIRAPKLVGLVESIDGTSSIIGILEEFIPSNPDPMRRTLQDIDLSQTSIERKRKWLSQIQQSVSYLHAIGVVWGDGKAGNVMIDETDGAWLIDFGGSYTPGWVDEKLAETVEGDLQALKRIAKFLCIEDS